ncbi:hypothetical protein GGX14DRAFT_658370 [Mycena pura]|uniref:Uncharacterized protein n=1 Tax=Mycena pura TaxID=153505 RepID=A0AAD6YML7_9AGAR|nr:hypothetical protein GGX14DRAFT_658370 [Mycena pura]
MTLSAIDTITGALLVGTWANSLLYAVELTQALYYFRHFQHDDWTLRTLVAVALFIDTVSTVGDYACVYLGNLQEYAESPESTSRSDDSNWNSDRDAYGGSSGCTNSDRLYFELVQHMVNLSFAIPAGITYSLGRTYTLSMLANLNIRRSTSSSCSITSTGVSRGLRTPSDGVTFTIPTDGTGDLSGIHVHPPIRTSIVNIDSRRDSSVATFESSPANDITAFPPLVHRGTASLPSIDALRRAHGSGTPAARRLAHLRALHPSRTTTTTPALRQLHASRRASNVPLRWRAKAPRATTQERTCAAVRAARPMSGRRRLACDRAAPHDAAQTTPPPFLRAAALRVLTNDGVPCGIRPASASEIPLSSAPFSFASPCAFDAPFARSTYANPGTDPDSHSMQHLLPTRWHPLVSGHLRTYRLALDPSAGKINIGKGAWQLP